MKPKDKQARPPARPYGGYSAGAPIEPDLRFKNVGPGTEGGEYLRRFWHPVAMASQLDAGRPVAVRILGEDLVVFRDGSGKIGLLHRHCAHRRASLEFGRIEEHGIRCGYHGWHFNVDGTILETPGEPHDSQIRHQICQGAYPVKELKGLIFAYLGPPECVPKFPYLDSMNISGHVLVPFAIHSPCNWLQASEIAMDQFHSAFLHGRSGVESADEDMLAQLPVVNYKKRPGGFFYALARRSGELVFLRFYDYLLPNLSQQGAIFQPKHQPKVFGRSALTTWVVPIDDVNCRKFGWRHFDESDDSLRMGARDCVGLEMLDLAGQTGGRSYHERQANPGDWDVWTSQGSMNVHKSEHLGVADQGILMLRSRLKRDIKAVVRGKDLMVLSGSKANPIRTFAGDTVLRVAEQSGDDAALLDVILQDVTEIYADSGEVAQDKQQEYIRCEILKVYPDSV